MHLAIRFRKTRISILLLFLAGACFSAQTQSPVNETDTGFHLVKIRGKARFPGRVAAQDSTWVWIKKENGVTQGFLKKRLLKLEPLDSSLLRDGEFWFPNPNSMRYLVGQSAIPLKPGEGYFQSTYALANTMNVGITDYLSIGAGIELVSSIGFVQPIFVLTSKLTAPLSENWHAGGVIAYGNMVGNERRLGGMGIAYGIATYGNPDNNVTFGLGGGFVEGDAVAPFITFSGQVRTLAKFSLVTENWVIPYYPGEYEGVLSGAFRIMGERTTFDGGLFTFASAFTYGDPVAIPFAALAVKF